jgi:hypothetical protein
MTKKHTLQWKTFPKRTKSAFSPDTIQFLATKYGFAADSVQALGMDVLVAMTSPVKKPDARLHKLQRTKGEARRDKARKSIEQAQLALAAADDEISKLTAEDANVLGAFDRSPTNWQAKLRKISADLERLREDLRFSAILEHALTDPTEHDKRLERDDVRINVMNVIFLFWQEQGRTLSLTTRPDRTSDAVTGPLLDFARDVVADLTAKGNILSADTLKADLKKARGQLEDFDKALPLFPSKLL